MGGRIHGFLGGVLLTSALTYYTGEYFQKSLQFVSLQLRSANNTINNRILTNNDQALEAVPKSNQIHSVQRINVAETAKDIWNDEIVKMVNWVYGINWYQWGITADKKLLGLADKVAHSVRD